MKNGNLGLDEKFNAVPKIQFSIYVAQLHHNYAVCKSECAIWLKYVLSDLPPYPNTVRI